MCDTITIIADTGSVSHEIETIGAFEKHFRVRAIRYGDYDGDDKDCLCLINISATLKASGVAYIQDAVRYFVGPVEHLRERVNAYTMNIYIP